jgi:hypothetical protein
VRGTLGAKGRREKAASGNPKGAGRKPGAQAGKVPWRAIQDAAVAGVPYDDILGGIDIHPSDLSNPETQERIRAIVERGNKQYKIELYTAVRRASLRKKPSVNTLALGARNVLDWDQQFDPAGQGEPDLVGVGVRLSEIIEKLSKRHAPEASCS